MVHGFVEELVVNEDPEYQWIDRIRTPRASNEARQRLISLMSGTYTHIITSHLTMHWQKSGEIRASIPKKGMSIWNP